MKIIVSLFTALVALASFAVPAKAAPVFTPVKPPATSTVPANGAQVKPYGFSMAICYLIPIWC